MIQGAVLIWTLGVVASRLGYERRLGDDKAKEAARTCIRMKRRNHYFRTKSQR
jgi:hypothetical protein